MSTHHDFEPPSTRSVREAARAQAERFSGSGFALIGGGVALLLMLAAVILDYYFNQDPRRILYAFIGATAFGGILMVPKFGILLFPVLAPLLSLIPPLPIPGLNALNVVLFSMFGVFALQKVMRRQEVFRGGFVMPLIGAFLLLAAVSIVRGGAFPTGYSYDVPDASLQLFRTAVGFAPYAIVLAMVRGEAERRRLAFAVVLGLVVETAFTIGHGRSGSGQRAVGTFGQPNELGSFLAIYSVFALALALGVRNWLGKLVLLATVVAGSFSVMLSLSRGAMVALIVGLGVVALRGSRLLLIALLTLVVSGPLWVPDYVIDRIMESTQSTEGVDEVALDKSADSRLQTWRTITDLVAAHPIDGVGWVGLGYVLREAGMDLGLEDVRDSAHNSFMRMLGELGVFGLALFVWLQWRCWEVGDRLFRRPPSAFDRALGLGVCGAVVCSAVSCAFGDRFFNVQISAGFWMLVGLAEDGVLESRGRHA